jgi:hypothetical protein
MFLRKKNSDAMTICRVADIINCCLQRVLYLSYREARIQLWLSCQIHKIFNNLFMAYLLSENRFGLSTETLLFPVVTTSALGLFPFLGFLVLCYFMNTMLIAFFAISSTLFWYIHLELERKRHCYNECHI